ncbi:MAG: adenylate cyclase [uncultured bacterium]|nr:MAG: adenylate cyclase [uncultured bacterium]OGH90457.1 MAG: hypothetical protein A2507_03585 [Candidatus Magasanikbacteria bacterium RIFOXYD12_FULL_33_17]HAO52444.1 hypothetical protein [Candidatus Magasanikbacteria bacterium]
MKEIERKFFIKTSPDISAITPWHSERFFLKGKDDTEERISKIQDKFYYDKKNVISAIERNREKKEITENEFNNLKSRAYGSTIRDTYLLSENPKITLQIYQGQFKGLIRAEVEFNSIEEADTFIPLSWMGKEITGLDIARDSTIL